MKYIKFLMLFSLLAIIVPNFVSAATSAEIQAQIQSLMQQLKALQEQLAAIQPTTAVWCHDFNTNIGINSSGPRSEVEALQTALGKEGFDIGNDQNRNFDEGTASAVSGFQQKYVDEILAPLKLKYGTGYLGKATRTKLNKLYGCGVSSSAERPVQVCNVFLTCETGYTSYNTGEKDNQSCPIIKCIPAPVPVHVSPVPIISEQVKCLFHESKTTQECYSSAGVGCKDISACVADVKGVKGEQITWKSTCGGYAYTTMDGNNEYAEFKCPAIAMPTPMPTPTLNQTQTPIPTTPQTPTIPPTTPIAVPTTQTAFTPTALSAEIIGGQSTYTPGQKIKFSVKGVASDGSIAVPAKGFNVQAWMQKTNPIETVKIGDMYQSFNADYDWNAGLWIVTMTVPSDDTSQIYKIEAALYCSNPSLGCSRPGQINNSFTFSIVATGTPTAPIPTTPKPVIPPSAVGTSTRKFKPIDPSRCPGIIETSCTIEPANIIKVSVYDEKGGFIDTRENNNSGMAGFLDLPYGNYTVVINAEGFEYYKAPFTVCATCEAITTIYLKKTSTVSQNNPPKITGGSALPPTIIHAGQTVNFSWNAQDEDKDNLFWSVNWGDGIGMATACPTSNSSSAQGWTLNTYHAWAQAGTYFVKVTVSDCKGGTDSLSVMVNVGAATPAITVTPSITVLSPNGGERWQAGNYYEVKWINTTGWSVKIEIIKGDSLVASWSPINSTASTHSIGLPLPLEAGSDYKIRITTVNTGIVDSSDAPFSIVAAGTSIENSQLEQMASVLQSIKAAIEGLTR